MENKFGKIVEAFDQKVGRDYLVLRLFFLHVVNEILERGLYDDAIKPGSIVVGGTDIVDDGKWLESYRQVIDDLLTAIERRPCLWWVSL